MCIRSLAARSVRPLALLAPFALAAAAMAQGADPYTPGTMPAVILPFSAPSIVTAIVTVGVVILGAMIGPRLGFALIKRLAARLGKAV